MYATQQLEFNPNASDIGGDVVVKCIFLVSRAIEPPPRSTTTMGRWKGKPMLRGLLDFCGESLIGLCGGASTARSPQIGHKDRCKCILWLLLVTWHKRITTRRNENTTIRVPKDTATQTSPQSARVIAGANAAALDTVWFSKCYATTIETARTIQMCACIIRWNMWITLPGSNQKPISIWPHLTPIA